MALGPDVGSPLFKAIQAILPHGVSLTSAAFNFLKGQANPSLSIEDNAKILAQSYASELKSITPKNSAQWRMLDEFQKTPTAPTTPPPIQAPKTPPPFPVGADAPPI